MSSGLPTLEIIFSDLRTAQEQHKSRRVERARREWNRGKRGKVKWNPVTSREEYLNTYLTQVVPAPCFN
jgi:hypothetical protein